MPWFHEIQAGHSLHKGRILVDDTDTSADEGTPADAEVASDSAIASKLAEEIEEPVSEESAFKDVNYPAPILDKKFI